MAIVCLHSSTCSAQFFACVIILIWQLSARMFGYTFHWDECNGIVSRRSTCNYFCVVHFFCCCCCCCCCSSLLLLLFKLSYHSQVLLLMVLFSLLLMLLFSPKIIHWHMLHRSHVNISIDSHSEYAFIQRNGIRFETIKEERLRGWEEKYGCAKYLCEISGIKEISSLFNRLG